MGLFCKLRCQRKECGKEFRLLDYRGFLHNGTLTCPACFYVQFGGFQQLTTPIECLKCHMSYPKIKFYCNSKSNGNNIECICPSPHCQTKQEDALYHFYREAKNSYVWYGNHLNLTQRPHKWCKEIYGYCELSSASLQQVGLSFGLSSHKLYKTILKNVDNKDYQLGMCHHVTTTVVRML